MTKFLILLLAFFWGCRNNSIEDQNGDEIPAAIVGTWIVCKSNVLPFEHISFCEKLGINSVFEFDQQGNIRVYESQEQKENCNQSQTFWVDSLGLNIFEYDFSYNYKVLKLTSDSLVLSTNRVPKYIYKEAFEKGRRDIENDVTREISKNGIVISFVKYKNGG